MNTLKLIICFVFLAWGIAHGQTTGNTSAQNEGRNGPPPEAFTACEGKSEGARTQFTSPRGEVITGTCKTADGRLVLRPDRAPGGNSQGGRRGPPPEAYKACEGKSSGSTAQFINPRGETVTGKCESENGTLVLRPDNKR